MTREEGVGRSEDTLAPEKNWRWTKGGREMGAGSACQVQQSRCERWSNTDVSGRERHEIY